LKDKTFCPLNIVPPIIKVKVRSFDKQNHAQEFIGNGWIDGCMAVINNPDFDSKEISPRLLTPTWDIIHHPSGFRVVSLMDSCLLRDIVPVLQICKLSITARIYAAWLKDLDWGDPIDQVHVDKIKKKLSLEFVQWR
jgi:hypothetical protein